MNQEKSARMNRREFLRRAASGCAAGVSLVSVAGCRSLVSQRKAVMTVRGPVSAESLGFTLSHEHVLVDFIGADKSSLNRYDQDFAFRTIVPHLEQARSLGCRTLVECTPSFLGKDPELLVRLAKATGLHILTNTGYYGASDNKFLPPHAWTESAEQLSARWLAEWRNGIGGSGVRPGLIKIGVGGDGLSELHRKLVRAAALTHKGSGLVIASHTGPSKLALEQLAVLRSEQVEPGAFIWVHAQAEPQIQKALEVAETGCWVSYDGFGAGDAERYVKVLRAFADAGRLGQLLVSHDAGWFRPGEVGGGEYREHDDIFRVLLPALSRAGIQQATVDQVFRLNPARCFALRRV